LASRIISVDGECALLSSIASLLLIHMHVLSALEGVFGLATPLLLHHLALYLMYLLSLVEIADPHGARHLALFLHSSIFLMDRTPLGRLPTSPRRLQAIP